MASGGTSGGRIGLHVRRCASRMRHTQRMGRLCSNARRTSMADSDTERAARWTGEAWLQSKLRRELRLRYMAVAQAVDTRQASVRAVVAKSTLQQELWRQGKLWRKLRPRGRLRCEVLRRGKLLRELWQPKARCNESCVNGASKLQCELRLRGRPRRHGKLRHELWLEGKRWR